MRLRLILSGMCALFGWLVAPGSSAAAAQPAAAAGRTSQLANRYWQLRVSAADGHVRFRLQNKPLDLCLADGPYLYRAERANGRQVETCRELQGVQVTSSPNQLVIRGQLAGLELEHRFTLLPGRPVMEERIELRNRTDKPISLSDFEAGFVRRVMDRAGQVSGDIVGDRWVAVPLRARATDPKGYVNDFSIQDLIAKPGYEPRVNKDLQYSQLPSRHRAAEGWAWTHGSGTVGIFVFNQENMLFSVVSAQKDADGAALRFGGACMISGEPAALTRIAPGEAVDLGTVRYQSLKGGYPEAMYAFRALLDEKGCRFPADYNPPVHWEQLYDMPNAWEDRPHRYTKAIVEKEAAKGRAYSCEALYLDPGWDTEFGTFLWGEQWLGTRTAFVAEMQSEFGLKLALHCPLATWVSHQYSWGLGAVKSWPAAAARMAPPEDSGPGESLLVPAVREGRRNLALLPAAKSAASSVFQGGAMPIHQVAHLNDGWYGNRASWIADRMSAWAEIDLGAVYQIGKVAIGNDHARQYVDRAATRIRILTATNYNADSPAASWQTVAEYEGAPLAEEKVLAFAPIAARWVRVDILKGGQDMPRLDEIEVYEAEPVSREEAAAFARLAKRGPTPPPAAQMTGPLLCLGSRQYRDEAERRLLANCADGAVFLMYDGNWWNGGCMDPAHGHPVPYRLEDHIRANLDLAQRVHAKYPKVLIEMHDPGAGGSSARITPVYYKYGLPGSYDENWGFELMWDPLADLKETRARSLYYYNMGCNVPLYLHIDLRKDNESCLVLWWYASTCRHLGIGGTSPKPSVVHAQQQAMRRYRQLEGFYKRGEFYGLGEEVHLHVLPKESAFVVNLFNLSDETRTLSDACSVARLGLDSRKHYRTESDWATVKKGEFKVSRTMPPWSAQVAEFRAGGN
jgi:hypothetical protein